MIKYFCDVNKGFGYNFTGKLVVKAKPLPKNVVNLLDENADIIKSITGSKLASKNHSPSSSTDTSSDVALFYNSLKEEFDAAGDEWKDIIDEIWSFGPRNYGPNILVNKISSYNRCSIWNLTQDHGVPLENDVYKKFDNSIITGFQLATLSGPLCEEPVMGVCFIIKEWTYQHSSGSKVLL